TLLVASIAAEQVVDRVAPLRAMLDGMRVAEITGTEMTIGGRAEPRLIEQHAGGRGGVVEAADPQVFVAHADQLHLAVANALGDQPAMKPIEPRIGKRTGLAALAPRALMERDELVVERDRVAIVARDLERDVAGGALRLAHLCARR